VPFTANTGAYTLQHVALLARDIFAKLFPNIASQPRARQAQSLQELAAVAYELCTVPLANSPEELLVSRLRPAKAGPLGAANAGKLPSTGP